MLTNKRIKVRYDKLGRNQALGMSYGDGEICIESKLRGKPLLSVIIHEIIHELWPDEPEESVIKKEIIIANTLWHEKFRKIEDEKK